VLGHTGYIDDVTSSRVNLVRELLRDLHAGANCPVATVRVMSKRNCGFCTIMSLASLDPSLPMPETSVYSP